MDYPEFNIPVYIGDIELRVKATYEVTREEITHDIETSLASYTEIIGEQTYFEVLYNGTNIAPLLEAMKVEMNDTTYDDIQKKMRDEFNNWESEG